MKIGEAIAMIDELCPNQFQRQRKIKWLSSLDWKVWIDVITTHDRNSETEFPTIFTPYDENTAADVKLLIPAPYCDDIYNFYLQSMIAKENAEIGKYNQASALFDTAYHDFASAFNRTHRPLPYRNRIVF